MEKMDGKIRRNKIIEILQNETEPVSGSALAKLTGVSRQVVVQPHLIDLHLEVWLVVARHEPHDNGYRAQHQRHPEGHVAPCNIGFYVEISHKVGILCAKI